MTPITDHIQQGLDRLIERYKNKPRFAAWCASHLRQVQKLEDAIQAFFALLDVDNADETRLKLLGKIVGQSQRGTLDQFRLYIKARIATNRSRGRIPDVTRVARLLLGPVLYREGRAHINIEAVDPIDFRDPDTSVEFLRDAKAAGVSLNLVFSDDAIEDSFAFAPGLVPVDDGRGFSDYADTTGGTLARIR